MTELKLQPITGPGEYTQRNGLKAEIFKIIGGRAYGIATGIDMEGDLGEFIFPEEWDITGSCSCQPDALDLVQPKPEIEIPEDVEHTILACLDFPDHIAVTRRELKKFAGAAIEAAIKWDRANRPKREPTADEITECYRKWFAGARKVPSAEFRDAILHAFELAQEPK